MAGLLGFGPSGQKRNELFTDRVFACLSCVILIGLAIEHLVFETLERVTVGQ